nr:MAG TPA: hypothetical protein [Caudoviricetes sp.]
MSKYILDDTPKTPFAIKHIEMVSIILSVLVGVVVGVCFWDNVDDDKKVVFAMALIVMSAFLTNVFSEIIEFWHKK